MLINFLYDLIKKVEEQKYKSVKMNFFARNAFAIIKNVMCNKKVLTQSDISLFFIIKIDVFDFN